MNPWDEIDWSVFEGHLEDAVVCFGCDCVFRSHAKLVLYMEHWVLYSQKPCPQCGGHRLKRATSDPEVMTIRAEKERT